MSSSRPVIVVGAGACGMVAALAAAEQGAEVLVFEKAPRTGGNTRLSTGLIPAAQTRLQLAAGIQDDSPQRMAEDILRKNRYQSDVRFTRRLCKVATEVVEWLVDQVGCALVFHPHAWYPGMSRPRLHGPPKGYGDSLANQLELAIRQQPQIKIELATPVTGLLIEDGVVRGVRVGETVVLGTAVILATGGFGANRDMVAQYLGERTAKALHYFGSLTNTGDGIRWGIEIGAAVRDMGAYQAHAAVAAPDGPIVTWLLVQNGAIIVNRNGHRFANETAGYSEFAAAVLAQPGQEAWMLFNQEVLDRCIGTRVEEVLAAGKAHYADTIEALARDTGLPEAAITETLTEVKHSICSGTVDRFGRGVYPASPIDPPYYWIHIRPALFHTQGGLVVDHDARVLYLDGTPVPGLYAGGGTAAGVSGPNADGYLSGNGLLAAVVLGYLAGRAAGRPTTVTSS